MSGRRSDWLLLRVELARADVQPAARGIELEFVHVRVVAGNDLLDDGAGQHFAHAGCRGATPNNHSSICAPISITRSGGMLKNLVAGCALLDMNANRLTRQRDMPGRLVATRFSRPRKKVVCSTVWMSPEAISSAGASGCSMNP